MEGGSVHTDFVGALWVLLVVLIGLWGWRMAAGILATNEGTSAIGKAMLAISD